jgi:hypothetical protein
MNEPLNTEEKIRWLAEQAGACVVCDKPDYEHSLDAIARDLLPILRERGWTMRLDIATDTEARVYNIGGDCLAFGYSSGFSATAAFEAIFEALHGETE